MEPNIKTAIIHFLANEFKLDPEAIGLDLNFEIDLNLTPDEVVSLLQRMQDALNFSLPEDRSNQLETITDLLLAVDPEMDIEE